MLCDLKCCYNSLNAIAHLNSQSIFFVAERASADAADVVVCSKVRSTVLWPDYSRLGGTKMAIGGSWGGGKNVDSGVSKTSLIFVLISVLDTGAYSMRS